MGLDMYLEKRTYVKNWNFKNDKNNEYEVIVKKGGDILKSIKPERVKEIVEEVAYWRKANAIHNWFVKNVQDGEDNCADYYVSMENLEALRAVVTEILEKTKLIDGEKFSGKKFNDDTKLLEDIMVQGKQLDKPEIAEELLPTADGFFFGDTHYDQYYWEDLQETQKILTEILEEGDNGASFYYSSSW